MIYIFTPVHGWFNVVPKMMRRVDETIPAPFIHYIFDDFSPEEHSKKYRDLAGEIIREGKKVGTRYVIHCKELGLSDDAPNLGGMTKYMFKIARSADRLEALLALAYNAILPGGAIEGFRHSQRFYGEKGGAFAPVVTVDGEKVHSFGGQHEDHFGMSVGDKLSGWRRSNLPRCEPLSKAAIGCLWIPYSTLKKDIQPDPDFSLYYFEVDLSKQIIAAGLDILVTDQVTIQRIHSLSTIFRLGEEGKEKLKLSADYQLKLKWGFIEEARILNENKSHHRRQFPIQESCN